MKRLICDIQLGGSTKQFLTWNKSNLSRSEFVETLKGALCYRAKTKPTKIARRMTALTGVILTDLQGEQDYYLDVLIEAFTELEKELNN